MSRPFNPWKMPDFRAGQNVICRIERKERDGYAVTISKDNLPGFLPTEERLKIGEEVLAQFVCIHNNRILLATTFSSRDAGKTTLGNIQWDVELAALNSKGHDQTTGTTEEERAFKVWAKQVEPQRIPLRRATDLLLPPLKDTAIETFTVGEHDIEWLITNLEGGMRTCCVKASTQSVLSRSAMLLYKGRCVGCIYSSKTAPEHPSQEESLQNMLEDLQLPDTKVTIYDLPENLILASSALFLGYPVERPAGSPAQAYFDYTLEWLESKRYTACITIGLTTRLGLCFCYIHRGQYQGAFYVEEQKFITDKNFVYGVFKEDENANINVQILPAEMTSSAIRFGYGLSVARLKRGAV